MLDKTEKEIYVDTVFEGLETMRNASPMKKKKRKETTLRTKKKNKRMT